MRVEGLDLGVQGLDAIAGSPVLDVEPYMREFAPSGDVLCQPSWSTELMRGYHRGDTPMVHIPTSHVDLLPTLLGLADIDVERAAAIVAVEHDETQTLPGRDLSQLLRGSAPARRWRRPSTS